MQIANQVEVMLEQRKLPYALLPHTRTQTLEQAAHSAAVAPGKIVRAVILEDEAGPLMAILPVTYLLDFDALRAQLGRNLKLASKQTIGNRFEDCEPCSIPPLAEVYGMDAIVDQEIMNIGEVYFEPGNHDCLVCMQSRDFLALNSGATFGAISCPNTVLPQDNISEFVIPDSVGEHINLSALRPAEDIQAIIESLDKLPAMPDMAVRLLKLRNNPKATIDELVEAVQIDPSLSAQVIRYSRSAFFNYRGKLESLQQAIIRVLGFDTVLNMALGLAASKSFTNSAEGPLGLHAFWRHATYSGALAQALAQDMPARLKIRPGTAYLCGLLHNFGLLLAGHLFKAEFFLVNKTVEHNPDIPVTLIEKRILGVTHCEIGTWLMDAWDMPGELCISMREHHNFSYQGEHALYANLILVTDQLLRAQGMGDGDDTEPQSTMLNALGLSPDHIQVITQRIMQSSEGLDSMAQQMVA